MHPDWQDDLHQYCEKHSSPEPELLQNLTAYTWRNTTNPRMLSGQLQGRFLSMIAALTNAECILEIGTFTGYSALCLAEGLMPGGELHSIEASAEMAWKAQQWVDKHRKKGQITIHAGEALKVIPGLRLHPDLIFVDADKLQYSAYLDCCLPLLKPGGLMLFDNTLWSGRVLNNEDCLNDPDTRSMHLFNQKVAETTGVDVVLLPLRDGLTMIRKK
ncbi:MAG: O-methyltransferase [Bacteroidetes bacterium]|jgi:predicted O-methyltransferase YrrM|nr:O-methyltransferase [Bacteroidota bacterium]